MTPDAIPPATSGIAAVPVESPGGISPVVIERRDPAGRLVARVGIADGMLEGPCLFFAEDGETVAARTLFRAGKQVLPPPGDDSASSLLGAPVASVESSF
ncbi:hypothetical protein FZ983_09625 [Azospirillum sp. B21]|uniref:hypothetical protein n=1 Tax=Azospirillum sp. B21 TaxID=2607496 RepID=UPI0011EEC1AC|nr:hypothetical protein [Azospirillum sp. B21]KAA0581188.1 hypothetical protein FZ983_09625 [Azospirillum sp. B21]